MNNDRICIVCINVAFANAATLQNELKCNIAIEKHEPKGYGHLLTKQPFELKNIPEADHYIFAGSGIMTRIDVSSLKGRKSVIISDSHYLRDTDIIDEIIFKNNIEVHCMIDLWKFCEFQNKKAYFHPFIDLDIPIEKNTIPTICHSPYSKHKEVLKGTSYIKKAISLIDKENVFQTDFIKDTTWLECLNRKSKANYFVDQLCINTHADNLTYKGGIGKSGLEAMLLKCLTFSSGESADIDVEFPPYEIVNSVDSLRFKIEKYLNDDKLRINAVKNQYNWVKKHTNPTFVSQRIIE